MKARMRARSTPRHIGGWPAALSALPAAVSEGDRRLLLHRRAAGRAGLGHRRARGEPDDETDAREDHPQAKPPMRRSSHSPSFRTVFVRIFTKRVFPLSRRTKTRKSWRGFAAGSDLRQATRP